MSSVDLRLPPGFRFHPTDEELVTHYLCRRCAGLPVVVPIIIEIDLYNYDPWQLPGKAIYGEKEWYFFSPRDRKYPNGSRPKRSAGTGYWRATGVDKPIGVPKTMGIKKTLVFYTGKAPKGEKTNWIMHEYRLAGVDRSTRLKNNLRLDDWVLYRIYNNKRSTDHVSLSHTSPIPGFPALPKQEPKVFLFPSATKLEQIDSDHHHFDWSEPMPRLQADSSSSDHVISTCNREVDSNLFRWIDAGDVSTNSFDVGLMSPMFKDPVLRDIYMYLEKPF